MPQYTSEQIRKAIHNKDKHLEQRMELLEPRFTTPSKSRNGHSSVSSDGSVANSALSSHSAASSHSFRFDVPSASRSPNGIGSNVSSASNELAKVLVRSKKLKSQMLSSDVSQAAARHMERVKESSPLMGDDKEFPQPTFTMDSGSQVSTLSNQTLITSHIKTSNDKTPGLVSPFKSDSKQGVMPKSDKRKSVPTKRRLPSVTDKSIPVPPKNQNPPKRKSKHLLDSLECKSPAKKARMAVDTDAKASLKGQPRRVTTNGIEQYFQKKATSPVHAQPRSLHDSSQDLPPPTPEKSDFELLRSQCNEWKNKCKDLSDQLKAVHDNQTITHTSLKRALSIREKELEEMKRIKKNQGVVAMGVIEKLIRSVSSFETKELRQKLANDGTRLGRITYTRAGMRTVETWEDGPASKALQSKKASLKARCKALKDHQKKVEVASQLFKDGQSPVDCDGVLFHNALDLVEAKESVESRLRETKRQEADLREEDEALNREKAEHIRALKRVANEDASRFKSKPTLHHRYVLMSLLGKGGFSEVWRAFDLIDMSEVAVKIHQLDPRWSEAKKENYTKHVSREYEIHRDVRHPRIVSLFDVFEIDADSFATVLECCKGTDLESMLKRKKRLPEQDARAILLQILSGMNYLSHSSGDRQGIIHYDLKPANILFDENGGAKITDFGLSKIVDSQDAESMELTSQGAGTYWYLPPECFLTSATVRISNKVDVWSIGVIFYQMIFGKRPFGEGISQDKVLSDHTMLNAREVHFPSLPEISPECKAFIQECLTYDQVFRPTIGQLCQHPYILSNGRSAAASTSG